MAKTQPLSAVLGIDIGRVYTRAALFSIQDEKYQLQAGAIAPTSQGFGIQIGRGVVEAVRKLQDRAGRILLKPAGSPYLADRDIRLIVDRIALVSSAGKRIRTAILGLTENGSLAAGGALIETLPLELVETFGLAELGNEIQAIEKLVQIQPEIVILTGGEDGGAERPIERWIEVLRLALKLIPDSARPVIVYCGNPQLQDMARRRLEPLSRLVVLPNLGPVHNERDLIPTQSSLDKEIIKIWRQKQPDFDQLSEMAGDLVGTKFSAIDRMVRYLSRAKSMRGSQSNTGGVLAIDLGGGSTVVSVGSDSRVKTRMVPRWNDPAEVLAEDVLPDIHRWTAAEVSQADILQFISNYALQPSLVPETLNELAIAQAQARVILQQTLKRIAVDVDWFSYKPELGMRGNFEPVVASGALLTQAPTPAQALLILLDSLQPWGITTFVLDQYHLLAMLGLIGEIDPILPVHVLNSDAFYNLGSVITAVSDAPQGEMIMTVGVKPENGKSYSVDILQGSLRRLVVPVGEAVVLDLEPDSQTDVGFGGKGLGGSVKVIGGATGVVIDGRGRPLRLASDDAARVEQLQKWLISLGG